MATSFIFPRSFQASSSQKELGREQSQKVAGFIRSSCVLICFEGHFIPNQRMFHNFNYVFLGNEIVVNINSICVWQRPSPKSHVTKNIPNVSEKQVICPNLLLVEAKPNSTATMKINKYSN